MRRISISTENMYVWIPILTMKIFFVVLLTSITFSVGTVIVYAVSIALWGTDIHFGYIRLFFILSILGSGVFSAYFIHVNKSGSLIYGVFTSLITFFLIGFAILNTYGS